jgi:hypothetical protein
MTPPKNTPEDPADLPVAEEPPEDQVQGMATPKDLEEVANTEEASD